MPMTVYAAETESEDDTESKTEEIMLENITWKIDIEESSKDTFDSGITPEEYFGLPTIEVLIGESDVMLLMSNELTPTKPST